MGLTDEQRRRNVAKVRALGPRLDQLHAQLTHALAAIPAMLREVESMSAMIDEVFGSAEGDGDGPAA